MPEQLTIVFDITGEFEETALLQLMTKAKEQEPKGKYEKRIWSINGLTVKQYEKSLVVQGSLNDYTKGLLRGLKDIKGLALDEKNAAKLGRVFPSNHNAILCLECKSTSLAIAGRIDGLDIAFTAECGHKNTLKPPLFMVNSRILPDINILISKSLSRLVELGYFVGFEVVVPEFILDVVDQFKGSGNKDAVSSELDMLRALEKMGKIRLNNLAVLPVKIDPSLFKEEDKMILELAQLTNSILLTSDQILKDRSVMQERPTVYIPPEVFGKIKMIQEVRNP